MIVDRIAIEEHIWSPITPQSVGDWEMI